MKTAIQALLERISAKASDGRYYHLEDSDREIIIELLNKHVEINATLIQLLIDTKVLTVEQIAPMLSYHYTVEE